jgi:hypothetical protein
MTIERYRHRRTRRTGPPADLLYGEIAYSDADQTLYIGRPDGLPPIVFKIGGLYSVRAVAAGGIRINHLGARL